MNGPAWTVAAENIRAADRLLLRTVVKAYCDYGFSFEDAKLRAELTFAAGIGLLHLTSSAEQANRCPSENDSWP